MIIFFFTSQCGSTSVIFFWPQIKFQNYTLHRTLLKDHPYSTQNATERMKASGKYSTRDLLQIELFPRHDTKINILGIAKITSLKEFVYNSLRKFLIESSVSESVANFNSLQVFLCKFLRRAVVSEKCRSLQNLSLSDSFQKNLDYRKLRQGDEYSKKVTEEVMETLSVIYIFHKVIEELTFLIKSC